MKGRIVSINVSETKGVSKTPVQGRVRLRAAWGIVGDVHAGTPDRDVTLLPREALGGVPYGGYGENIDTAGIAILDLPIGTVVKISQGTTGQRPTVGSGDEGIRLQITRHGKVCPSRCAIYYSLGNCIMQEKGVFAVVLTEGKIGEGDEISVETIPTAPDDIAWILDNCKRIALFGASPKADRPSHRVMRYLLEKGYEVIPIRPGVKEILGQRCYSTVQEVPGPIDLALSFRRSEDVPPLVEEAIARGAKAFWMQEGIVSPEAFVRALGAGLRVVMDRCMYKESLARET
jgi:predicted CoA-binding protein/MOSC domain-containing protein YiiM